eukprot:g722.t1
MSCRDECDGDGNGFHAHGNGLFNLSHGVDAQCDCCSEDVEGNSLWPYIDHSKVKVLNGQAGRDNASHFLKCFNKRKEITTWLESDEDDGELLIYIPFAVMCTVSALSVHGAGELGPSEIRAFKEKEGMNFTNAQDTTPLQHWECVEEVESSGATGRGIELVEMPSGEDEGGCIIDYATKVHKWQKISSITIHIPENFAGDGGTKLFYLGLKGKPSKKLTGVQTVDCVYEAMAQRKDHKSFAEDAAKSGF